MALIIKKFGGSSVADLDKIKFVAAKIKQAHAAGEQVVVVVSAMQGETDRLLSMAHKLAVLPDARELDVLLATGEQATIALLSMALIELGCASKSYTGGQVQILTNQVHNKARILNIDVAKIHADLRAGLIVVVAGFQGVDAAENVTTLGRGGSDTTAVALAAALQADECQIYTDVDGVYTADPRIVHNARRLDRVTFTEMLELASLGAKVLQIRSVAIAGRYNVPTRVLSTFIPGPGTLIACGEDDMEQREVVGIAHSVHEARIVVCGLANHVGYVSGLLGPLAEANIEVDMIAQTVTPAGMDFAFTVQRSDLNKTLSILNTVADALNAREVIVNSKVAKLSLVGVGMRSHTAITHKIFKSMDAARVHMHQISTSEIKVSVLIDEEYIELGVKALHEAFDLDERDILQTSQKNAENLPERA